MMSKKKKAKKKKAQRFKEAIPFGSLGRKAKSKMKKKKTL